MIEEDPITEFFRTLQAGQEATAYVCIGDRKYESLDIAPVPGDWNKPIPIACTSDGRYKLQSNTPFVIEIGETFQTDELYLMFFVKPEPLEKYCLYKMRIWELDTWIFPMYSILSVDVDAR